MSEQTIDIPDEVLTIADEQYRMTKTFRHVTENEAYWDGCEAKIWQFHRPSVNKYVVLEPIKPASTDSWPDKIASQKLHGVFRYKGAVFSCGLSPSPASYFIRQCDWPWTIMYKPINSESWRQFDGITHLLLYADENDIEWLDGPRILPR